MLEVTSYRSPDEARVRDVAGFLVGSFRFSRGTSELQESIFSFVAQEFGGNFNEDDIWKAVPRVVEAAHQYARQRNIHPSLDLSPETEGDVSIEPVQHEVIARAQDFIKYLNMEDENEHVDPQGLLNDVLNADENMIPHFKDHPNWLSPYRRAGYKSNLIHFGLMGRQTGRPEFNAFFASATQALWAEVYGSDGYWAGQARAVVTLLAGAHLSYNPGDAIEVAAVTRPLL